AEVGGLSKTVEHNGFRCDIGGHRFFTKNPEVEALWRETLPTDFLRRPRLSRIYYRGKLFYYPLRAGNALAGLGPWEGARVMASFARAKLSPRHPEVSFEDWVSNRFGYRLYSIFFRTYTEKVWGIPCTDLSADWAAQRIRNLDLTRAVLNAVGIGRGREVASLIDEFDYPRLGPGQMYETLAAQIVRRGGRLLLQHRVEAIRWEGDRVVALELGSPGGRVSIDADRVVSTMPLTDLVLRMKPEPPGEVVAAAQGLTYRSIITVNLMVERPEVVPDTWVYIHAQEVTAGRLQLYKNWSPAMVPDGRWNSLGLEYFSTEGDGLWRMPDEALIELARKDLLRLSLVRADEIVDGFVVRYPKAYPVYGDGYTRKLAVLRDYLSRFVNLECAGRYGQFRYNNMDHSILTGMLAARKLCGERCDPWSVNAEGEYLEEK
ncbi:MAG: NAD(P)/FAD-dependent oxidoreductase, partial [Chloroflexota bacterium]